ncbi:MAG: hypothetical protein GC153_07655 [Alphaproteobacteria bacterium]|nr:hypothetical protein [Alphaproteobacteria bacterium]
MGSGYFTRLAAVLAAAALLGAVILKPEAGRRIADAAARFAPDPGARPLRACAAGETPLAGPFAPFDDVLSISPLGAVTAPGEPLPTPYIRINTRRADKGFARRETKALAPARAEIVALERTLRRDADGDAVGQSWTVHFKPCDKITVYYDGLSRIAPEILRRAGGLKSFVELGGPDHIARQTHIPVRAGETIGEGPGFDVGLQDLSQPPAAMARPERYQSNPYDAAAVFDAPPSLIAAITVDDSRARCALDYLPEEIGRKWAAKLGDSWGVRKAEGEDACRTALVDVPGTAQGAWFTDASHNAVTDKISAIALAPDAVEPMRLIFALHGLLKSLTPDMVALPGPLDDERAEAARDFLSFDLGDGRINAPFDKVRPGQIYCYERLRANFVGPKIDGVLLMKLGTAANGAAQMTLEARGDVSRCIDLQEPWRFTGKETIFYR